MRIINLNFQIKKWYLWPLELFEICLQNHLYKAWYFVTCKCPNSYSVLMYGYYSRAVSNQEWVIEARARYVSNSWHSHPQSWNHESWIVYLWLLIFSWNSTWLYQHLDQTKTKSKFCGEKKIKICRFRIGYWMAWSLLVFLLFYLVAFWARKYLSMI